MNFFFTFGRNWKNYVNKVADERIINEAKESLLKFLPQEVYRDKTLIDIGCGSGLFSLASVLLGVKKVISFDLDEQSLQSTEILRNKFVYLIPECVEWDIFKGNILDDQFVNKLENTGDIVYSWGVLHHTGNMWKAVKNAGKLVKNNGYFIIAIYNYAESSRSWWKIKRFYNKYVTLQPIMNIICGCFFCIRYILKNRKLNLYRERGMHVFYDAIDWLGGYPYEYACFNDVNKFVEEELKFKLIKSPTILPCGKGKKTSIYGIIRTANIGCNEFVFFRERKI